MHHWPQFRTPGFSPGALDIHWYQLEKPTGTKAFLANKKNKPVPSHPLSFPSKNQPQDRYKPYNPTNHFKNQPQNIKSTDINFINLTNHSKNQLQDLYIQYNSTCYLYFRKNSKKKKNFSRNEHKRYSVAGSKGKESNARRADRRRAPAVGDSPPVTHLPASRTLASLAGSWLLRLQQQQQQTRRTESTLRQLG